MTRKGGTWSLCRSRVNYDRVLEDRVLVAAHAAGERRFTARLSTVLGFVGRMLRLRLKGQFHRFGYASVSFGEPLSLKAFGTRCARAGG